MPEFHQNSSKSLENRYKIDEKRSQIEKNASLEFFRRQIAPRSALGRSPSFGVVDFGSLFGRKCRFKGRFGDPWNIENLSKNALLEARQAVGPPKMASGRRIGKNLEF